MVKDNGTRILLFASDGAPMWLDQFNERTTLISQRCDEESFVADLDFVRNIDKSM